MHYFVVVDAVDGEEIVVGHVARERERDLLCFVVFLVLSIRVHLCQKIDILVHLELAVRVEMVPVGVAVEVSGREHAPARPNDRR